MFTGIIKKLSKVENASWNLGSLFVGILIPKGWEVKAGESISVNGVCSTVKKVSKKNFTVEYMPETVKKTTVGGFQKGTKVNLERSLRVGDLMDGHIVQGHVDCVGKVIGVDKVKSSKVIRIRIPKEFTKFMAPKGSVAVDGISLTIVDSKKDWLVPHHNLGKNMKTEKNTKKFGAGFTVSLVNYTLENTNLGKIKVGEKVNIEVDAIAKYINKLLKYKK